jgi:hypothetical protein
MCMATSSTMGFVKEANWPGNVLRCKLFQIDLDFVSPCMDSPILGAVSHWDSLPGTVLQA